MSGGPEQLCISVTVQDSYGFVRKEHKVSKTLDDLLERAGRTRIVCGEEMDRITEKLLDLSYAELKPSETGYQSALCSHISGGFELDANKVRDCSIREIITLISYEPGVGFFRSKDMGSSLMNRKVLPCACSCVGLVQELQQARENNPWVQQFMLIDFSEYVDRMAHMVYDREKAYEKSETKQIIDSFFVYRDFMKKHYLIDAGRGDCMVIQRVMQYLMNKARKNWLCGQESIVDYKRTVEEATRIITEFFMIAMRTAYVKNDRAAFAEIIKKCSLDPDRDMNFVDYKDCYERSVSTGCHME